MVRSASLRDMRTYESVSLSLEGGLTVFAGPNGVGKTNFLEGIAWGLLGASPRTTSELRCIRQGTSVMRVELTVDAGGDVHTTAAALGLTEGKRLWIDGDPVRSVDAFARVFPAVTFLPERLLVVRGAPARRRALLDRLVTRLTPAAGKTQRAYVTAITQRNTLLRRARGGADVRDALTPWTQQIAELGVQVRTIRDDAVTILEPLFTERFQQLTGLGGGALRLTLRGGDDLAAALHEQLALDLRRGTTSAGPHLDDLQLLHGARELATFGSTGEQRAALLAWALAEADALSGLGGPRPVLLLDEPYAELDPSRRERLTATLLDHPQAIVTTTEPDLLGPAVSDPRVSLRAVSSGVVSPWTTTPSHTNPPPTLPIS